MNFSSSLNYLNSFINFERIALNSPQNFNLDRMRFLLDAFDHPDHKFFPVIIAGTKGKGSTGFFLESILTHCGVRCGFYSSPHLQTPLERIRLCAKMISKKEWIEVLAAIQKKFHNKSFLIVKNSSGKKEKIHPTYFEVMTLMAALAMKQAKVEIGIFEVGLGGRLDATNALDHRLAILTPIDFDHQAVLGSTLEKIATEKAAVIRTKEPVVVAPQRSEAAQVIKQRAKNQKASLTWVRQPLKCKVGLQGDYQQMNAAVAYQAAQILDSQFSFKLNKIGIGRGLSESFWPGRFEVIHRDRQTWLLDSAHNPMSIVALARNLHKCHSGLPWTIIFGTSKDKDSRQMLEALAAYCPEIILTQAQNFRAAEVSDLMAKAKGLFEKTYPFATTRQAFEFAKLKAGAQSIIVVTGSFFVVGEVRSLLKVR